MMRRRVALTGAAAILVLLALRFAAAQAHDASDTLVLNVPSNQWFEGPGERVSISSDAKWALLTHGRSMSLYSLETREQNQDFLLGGLASVFRAGFCGPNAFVRLGQRGSERGIFLPGSRNATAFFDTARFSGQLLGRRQRDRLLRAAEPGPPNVCRSSARSVQNVWSHRANHRDCIFAR